jgi:hypothetical protein
LLLFIPSSPFHIHFLIASFSFQKKPWFFPKDEEKAHLAEICPQNCRRCEICRADVLKSEYDAHMKDSLVLHMSFMMTLVAVCSALSL